MSRGYSDETVRIHVPEDKIKEYLEHPEEYDDYIVVLNNEMWIDVYSDEDDGQFYTYTNDEALINYLSSKAKDDEVE